MVGLPSFSETYLPLNCYVSTFDFANRERFEGPTKRLVFLHTSNMLDFTGPIVVARS